MWPPSTARSRWPVLLALSLQAAGCAVEPGESFTLRVGDATTVRGTEIRIRLDGVGHGWLAQGGGHFLFADLTVASETGSRSLMAERGDEIRVGEYTLEVIGIDEEERRCTLRVVAAMGR